MRLTFDLQPGDDRLFTDESLEQIGQIERGLLELEHGLDPGVVNEVFRAAHTLKGSAAMIGHRRMAELTHAMEDLFGAFRSGTLRDVKPFADVLLTSIDVLRTLVAEVRQGSTLTDAPESLTGQLRELLSAATATPGHGAPEPNDRGALPADEAGVSDSTFAPLIRRLLWEAPGGYEPRSLVVCRIDPMSKWQAVRLLQLVIECEEMGVLIASAPDRQEIESELGSTLLAMLVHGRPFELFETRARLAAIEEVLSVEVVAAPTDAPGEAATEAPIDAPSASRRAAAAESSPSVEVYRPQGSIPIAGTEQMAGTEQIARASIAGEQLKLAQQTIRIDVTRLDELMDLVGELVVHKTRLAQSAQELAARLGDDPLARRADEDAQQFARIASQLQDQATGLRMLPIDTVFSRFPRVVRDIDSQLHKEVQLIIEGKETELDRSVLEVVGDPLGHLVRNALDHGIEPPEERRALGKPLPATVRLTARHADGRILITVEDDGRGMDPAALRQAAVDKGLMSREAAESLTDAESLRIIFAPGFSTSKYVSEVSGRGVGLDVVRNNIEKLGGWVDVSSVTGEGTRISLSLPLTLAIIGALLVRSGPRVCALPLTGVVETLRIEPASLGRVRGHNVLSLRDRVIPVERLDGALGDPPRPLETDDRGFVNLVVVHSRNAEMALAVDAFVGQHEIVLKSLSKVTGERMGLAGATVLADGTVGLVVDIAALIERRTSNSGPAARPTTRVA
ncbi:MAG TPA: chemotaxis protein CheA [Candidatus Limnocylindrales bacterium]|jgi:two-component system chemotaxis sensor kinase CheA|nr:chemotaxis protein CheA [Candidatus Limnocylindrales bacterium]